MLSPWTEPSGIATMCAMGHFRLAIAALIAALAACGSEQLPNSNRAGYIALSADEAWQKVGSEFSGETPYALCPEVSVPCGQHSAYLRDRNSTYWFVLHDVAARCQENGSCQPDTFTYVEVEALGRVIYHGMASVQYDASGQIRQVIGETRWAIPDLEQPKPYLLTP